jgi:hypothetical protein
MTADVCLSSCDNIHNQWEDCDVVLITVLAFKFAVGTHPIINVNVLVEELGSSLTKLPLP